MSRTETEPVRQIVNLPRLGTLVILILLVAGGAYWFGANSVGLKEVPALWALGMDQPSENRLDPKFRDADANLVADPPADEADWLDPPVLTFSYLATDQDQYEEAWSEALKFVGERCGRTVEFRRQESPDSQLAGLDSGELHIAGINSGAVPVAVNQSGFSPLCSFGADGKLALYAMQVITRKDSPIQTVSDLRGRRLALTDPTSNSGWKAPLHLLN
jgi:phosphonate transport system substrate-binding protein